MKVLIICNDFPPLNSIGARRPYSWFQYFRKYGIDPLVLTKDWSGESESPQQILDQKSYGFVIEEEKESGTIIRVPAGNTLPERLLVNYGEQQFIFVRRTLTFIYRILSFMVPFFDKHYSLYREAKKILREQQIDCIIITGEPFILFKYGYLLTKKFHIPWIADYRDGWKLNHVSKFNRGVLNRFMRWMESYFEKKYITSCRFITSVDPYLASLLEALHHQKAHVIYNGFDQFYEPVVNGWPKTNRLVITHSGTITPGQQVEFFLQAISELHHEHKISSDDLEIHFIGLKYFPVQEKRILNFDPAIQNYFHSTPRLPRNESLSWNYHSDLLLAFTEKEYPLISAKTYDYIAVKRPVMMVPDDGSLLSSFIKNLNAGYSFTSTADLKTFLLSKIEMKKKHGNVGNVELNESKALFYMREKQAELLASLLKEQLPAAG